MPANCTLDPVSNSTFDDRFVVNPHFKVSESKLQRDNGVLSKLELLPMYSDYVNTTSKNDINYRMYTRHTPTWALSCENSTHTSREGIFTAYKTELTWNAGTLLTVHLTSMVLLAMTAQCLAASCCTGYRALAYKHNSRYFLIQVGTMGTLQILSIIFCFIHVEK